MIVDIFKREEGNQPVKLGTFIGTERGLEDIVTAINLYVDTEEGWNTDFTFSSTQSKHFITILDEETIYNFNGSIEDCVKVILEEYQKWDISMVDFVEFININGIPIADVTKVYARLFNISDNDKVIRIANELEINLAE